MAALAKLSRPRLAGVLSRERMFARLDEYRQQAAVWISGPPGAGKTTLVASYLDARDLRALWYQVDSGDADPASFFFHLRVGAKQAGLSRKVHLPLLTPEYMSDLGGFARRYFRDLFQGLPQPCLLVLDNVQDAPEASPFGTLIRDALTELPPGAHAMLVSRGEPPAELSRLRVSQALAELGWDELRLTEDEAAQIAASSHRAPANLQGDAIGVLVRRCGGWAAGLTLLLQHALASGRVADSAQSRQALFDYFAAELFDRLPGKTRHLLLCTALLPWVSVEMARNLSGSEDAAALLEGLRRRHLFTERRTGALTSYQYHALFREFLQERMERVYTVSDGAHLARRSAQLLSGAGHVDAALQLFLKAGDDDAALQLVLGNAPVLAAQGRLQTLAACIAALPARMPEAVPWLAYWRGVCQLGSDVRAARAGWEAAFELFGEQGDTLGQVVVAAGIIESHNVEFLAFTQLDPWIAQLQRLLALAPRFPDPALELSVLGSLLGALLLRKPERELVAPHAVRIRLLIDAVPDVNSRVAAATRLLHQYTFLMDLQAGEQLVAHMKPHLADPHVSPHNRCLWLHFESFWFAMYRYDERKANEAMNEALDIVERHGLGHFRTMLEVRAAHLRLDVGDLDAAAQLLARSMPALEGSNPTGWHHGMQSWLLLLRGDLHAAVTHAQVLVRECASAGMPHGYDMALLLLANALAAAGDRSGALDCLRRKRQSHFVAPVISEMTANCIDADIQLTAGDVVKADGLLRRAFSLAHRDRLFNTLQWLAPQMSRLCAFALEHGIEASYVAELILVRGLRPPSPDTRDWPWPIKLRTLGRFEVLADDAPLQVTGKTQRKPMALLKALVALGGSDVAEDKLIDIVWADSLEGDAQKAFDVTVHRLRKLLGKDQAIHVSSRRVSLNRELVWVDLWALDRQLAAVIPLTHAQLPDIGQLESTAPAVLDLYRGHFLDGEPDAGWLLPVRNRLAGRFQRFVIRLGEHREAGCDWSGAAELYERAIELDPLAEAFYCRLMVCLREQGRRAEAIEVFRRCRLMLSVTLGVKPVAATEAVYCGLTAT